MIHRSDGREDAVLPPVPFAEHLQRHWLASRRNLSAYLHHDRVQTYPTLRQLPTQTKNDFITSPLNLARQQLGSWPHTRQ
jgi:hypothetical protein